MYDLVFSIYSCLLVLKEGDFIPYFFFTTLKSCAKHGHVFWLWDMFASYWSWRRLQQHWIMSVAKHFQTLTVTLLLNLLIYSAVALSKFNIKIFNSHLLSVWLSSTVVSSLFSACFQLTSLSSRAHEGEGSSEDAVEDRVSQVQLLWSCLPLPPGNHSCYSTCTSWSWTGAWLTLIEPVTLLIITWTKEKGQKLLPQDHEHCYRCIYCVVSNFLKLATLQV